MQKFCQSVYSFRHEGQYCWRCLYYVKHRFGSSIGPKLVAVALWPFAISTLLPVFSSLLTLEIGIGRYATVEATAQRKRRCSLAGTGP